MLDRLRLWQFLPETIIYAEGL